MVDIIIVTIAALAIVAAVYCWYQWGAAMREWKYTLGLLEDTSSRLRAYELREAADDQ